MTYDDNNIFAKILRGEIPCNKIYENRFKPKTREKIQILTVKEVLKNLLNLI